MIGACGTSRHCFSLLSLALSLRRQECFQTASNERVPTDAFLLRQCRAAVEQHFFEAHNDRLFILPVLGTRLLVLGALPADSHWWSQGLSLVGHELVVELLRGFLKFLRRHFPIRFS